MHKVRELQALVQRAMQPPLKQQLFDVRGYMFHRDRRAYTDAGRLSPISELPFMTELHTVFVKMMLAVMGKRRRDRNEPLP